MKLSGKNVIYVGGCGGIGAASCRLIAQRRVANLVILDLNENLELINELRTQSPSVNVFFSKCDISNKANVETSLNEVIAKITHIDVLVNGSGIFNDMDPKKSLDVNLLGVIYTILAAMEFMDKTKGGKGGVILNIASVSGLNIFKQAPVYSASKAGVVMFSRNLGDDFHFKRTGVSVIVICPGVTDTKILDNFKEDDKCQHVSAIHKMLDYVKIQKPEDCARHIVECIELNQSGKVYVSYDGWMKEVPMQSWTKAVAHL